jgi:2-(1,2-epoxy-1,2-dihydrophenyl)acetyl-CoA isomerase
MGEDAAGNVASDAVALVERNGGVLSIAMNRVASRNALDGPMKDALQAAAEAFCGDATLRCLVITGSERIFCAGGDLRTLSDERRPTEVRQRMAQMHGIAKMLTACEKPIITAVNGAAVGAGFGLALFGDIVVAAEDAFFMAGFPKVGAVPDAGVIYHLPRAVGMAQAKDILLTNRKVGAAEALAIGLVSRVLPRATFRADVLALAEQLAAGPSVSLGLTKALLNHSHRDGIEDFLTREQLAQAVVFGTDDFAEGNRAFMEKREPRFNGR